MPIRFLASLRPGQLLILVSSLLAGVGDGVWLHLQSLYVEFLGAQPQQIGATLSLAGLSTVVVIIPAGLLADRWKRRPLIVGSWLATTAALLWLAWAPNWRWAIPGFALYSLSFFGMPAMFAHIASTDRSEKLGRIFALTSAAYALGGLLGPAGGGWIAAHLGLRAVFLVAAAFYVVSTVTVWFWPDSPMPPRAGAIHPRRLLSNRPFLWQIFVFLVLMLSLDLGVVLAPNYLQDVRGLNVQQIGQLGTLAALGMVTISVWLGRMPVGRRMPLILNQLIVILALLLLLSASGSTGAGALVLYLAYFLRGASNAVLPLLSGRLGRWLPPDVLSLGFGFRDTAVRIALALSPLIAGQLYALRPTLPLVAGILALCATMLLTLTLPHFRPSAAVELASEAPMV